MAELSPDAQAAQAVLKACKDSLSINDYRIDDRTVRYTAFCVILALLDQVILLSGKSTKKITWWDSPDCREIRDDIDSMLIKLATHQQACHCWPPTTEELLND